MALPVAAIVCIALAAWVLVILLIFALCQFLKARDVVKPCECAPCGKEDNPRCSECCVSLSESCDCCRPSVNGCLNSMCPSNKKIDCIDILLCQCCAGEGEESCFTKLCCSCCSECQCCEIECCSCVESEAVTCCCLEIRLRKPEVQVQPKHPEPPPTSRSHDSSTPPSSARSLSQLQFSSSTDLYRKRHTSSKDSDDETEMVHVGTLNERKKSSQRLLPVPPKQTRASDTSASKRSVRPLPTPKGAAAMTKNPASNKKETSNKTGKKAKQSSASELVEVAVENTQNIVMLSLNYNQGATNFQSFKGVSTGDSQLLHFGSPISSGQSSLNRSAPMGGSSSGLRPLPSRPPT